MAVETEKFQQDGAQQARLGTGLSIWRGTVDEEYLSQLQPWSRAYKVFRDMRMDVVIGGLLEAIKTPLLSTSFEVHPASDTDEDKRLAETIRENLFQIPDMEWREHVEEMLDFIDFGFSLAEKVAAKAEDGSIRLRALVPIGQDTLLRWGEPDNFGRVTSFVQWDTTNFPGEREAPMDKLLHFAWRPKKRNPMGSSILRDLYRPWFFKKNLETVEAIGAERDVGNAPVAKLGEGYYSSQQIDNLESALKGFRVDEAMYVILPHGVELSPFGSGGKVYNVRAIIRDYQHLIRQRFFADFLALGSEQVGTQALAREMTTFFGVALRSVQERMLEVWNRQLVPWILHLNGKKPKQQPLLAWNPPSRHNLQSLAQSLTTLVNGGILTQDASLEPMAREVLGLPPLSKDLERKKEKLSRLRLDKAVAEARPETAPAETPRKPEAGRPETPTPEQQGEAITSVTVPEEAGG